MKKYPLEIVPAYEFEGGSSPFEYYSRGHHDKEEFLDKVDEEYDPWFGMGDTPSSEYVRHEYWRTIPTPSPDGDDTYVSLLYPTKKGAGAFPVTVVDV